jgi:TolA-binding protein
MTDRNLMMRLPLIAALLLAGTSVPLLAQTDTTKLRVDKLEKEVKAIQRKVFPNGVALQPELGTTETATSGTASNPVSDLTSRIDSLESQLRTLTGQVETNDNRLKKLDDAFRAFKADADTRLKGLEGTGSVPTTTTAIEKPAVATPAVVTKPATTMVTKPAVVTPVAATTTKASPTLTKPAAVTPAKPATTAKADPARKAAIAAVELPATGDAAEDAYSYGYRLWSSKLYPEAQVKLREFVQKYPSHKRTSYAQNLLGRAFYDEAKYNNAAVAFFENYTKNPKGERAAESLTWLGSALFKLKKLPDACKVYSEFDEVYGAKAAADLKARVAKGRTDAKCAA